jgi:hypothetical protein
MKATANTALFCTLGSLPLVPKSVRQTRVKRHSVSLGVSFHLGLCVTARFQQCGTSLFWCHKYLSLSKAATLHQKPFNGCVLTKKKKKKNKNMVWHRKEAPLFKISQLPWDYPELQIKPQAESDMSAGTEKIPCHFCQPLIWKRRLCLGGLRSSQMICSQCSCGRWRGRLCAPNTVPGWRWTEH